MVSPTCGLLTSTMEPPQRRLTFNNCSTMADPGALLSTVLIPTISCTIAQVPHALMNDCLRLPEWTQKSNRIASVYLP